MGLSSYSFSASELAVYSMVSIVSGYNSTLFADLNRFLERVAYLAVPQAISRTSICRSPYSFNACPASIFEIVPCLSLQRSLPFCEDEYRDLDREKYLYSIPVADGRETRHFIQLLLRCRIGQ
jgi:hypothetical protein